MRARGIADGVSREKSEGKAERKGNTRCQIDVCPVSRAKRNVGRENGGGGGSRFNHAERIVAFQLRQLFIAR